MIGFLRGKVVARSEKSLLLDVHGVGYEITMPFSELAHCKPSDNEITVFTHLIWREENINLYGFLSALSRDLFRILMDVSGVGSKVSLNILSHIKADELLLVLSKGDAKRLEAISGVGKKTAAKICLEVKEKVKALVKEIPEELNIPKDSTFSGLEEDALSVLVQLGFRQHEARIAIEKVISNENFQSVEDIVKHSLQLLGKSN